MIPDEGNRTVGGIAPSTCLWREALRKKVNDISRNLRLQYENCLRQMMGEGICCYCGDNAEHSALLDEVQEAGRNQHGVNGHHPPGRMRLGVLAQSLPHEHDRNAFLDLDIFRALLQEFFHPWSQVRVSQGRPEKRVAEVLRRTHHRAARQELLQAVDAPRQARSPMRVTVVGLITDLTGNIIELDL